MGSERSLFCTLPAELYDNIFEESFRIDGLVSLQCMRLVARHYAYLPSLLRITFRKIVLPVSLESAADLPAIAPHVKHIVFKPTGYSWAMDLDTYRQILFRKSLRKACRKLNQQWAGINDYDWSFRTSGRYLTTGNVSPLTFVKYYMGNKPPYTEEDVASRYGQYMTEANQVKELFENGEFAEHWTQIMRQMKGDITLETRHWRFKEDHKHDSAWIEGDHAHTTDDCMKIHGTVGEILFDTILKCATDARVRINTLNVFHCVRTRSRVSFPWASDGRLNDVDLQGISFEPLCPAVTDRGDPQLAEIIIALLAGTASKLRHFELFTCPLSRCVYHEQFTCWPPLDTDIVRLPLLERFKTTAEISVDGLGDFIRESRNLKHLHLDDTLTKSRWGGGRSWRRFWRSIRYHPSRMVVDITCQTQGRHALYVRHDTGTDSVSGRGIIQYSIEMYVSNRGSWDKLCEDYFGESKEADDTDEEEMED